MHCKHTVGTEYEAAISPNRANVFIKKIFLKYSKGDITLLVSEIRFRDWWTIPAVNVFVKGTHYSY